jgi:hypothetical protein
MSRTDLLTSLCLGALLTAIVMDGGALAGPAPSPKLLPVATVMNEKVSPAAPAAAEPPAAPMPNVFAVDVKVPTIATVTPA